MDNLTRKRGSNFILNDIQPNKVILIEAKVSKLCNVFCLCEAKWYQ